MLRPPPGSPLFPYTTLFRSVLLCGCVLVAAAASYVLPAGQFDRRHDAATGRDVVIAGTYHGVPPHRVTPFGALVAIPRGLADAAAVIFFVFLIGGAFTVVDETGALRQGVEIGRASCR